MTTDRLLLVDDEPQISRWLLPALRASGYEVDAVGSGGEALAALADDPRDLVLLDLGLPDLDGKAVIARLREWSDAPIVVISARDPLGEPIVTGSVAITRDGGITTSQLLACIEGVSRLLSATALPADPKPKAAPGGSPACA